MSFFEDSSSLFEDIPAMSPVQFFGLAADSHFRKEALKVEKKDLLPTTSDLLNEEHFADVYSSWNFEKLSFIFVMHVPYQRVIENDFRKGDSIEIFLDTRDLKTKGVVTRFCHHFVFFPLEVQNFYGREISRFRGEDTHRLCHPEDLSIDVSLSSKSYAVSIEIPSHCLHGYDPLSFPRIGFTYQINRFGGKPQHFAVSSEEYLIEQHPATWGTLKLLKGDD